MMRRWIWVAIALGSGGCDRTHMSPHFGEANREAFRAQVIDLDAGNRERPNPPLDPEEAATIARSLSKSLAPAAMGTAPRDSVLVVSPPAAGTGAAPPAQEPSR
ncbi:hypothetical protein LVJ94_32780 [Pendulispora rubella]|uniref:Uncharacterized protein n=1 Tax=Pendulispora rubella TaxID=2741070 RepID=A0ABZ2KXH8_9BACT